MDSVPKSTNVEAYVRILHEDAERRRLIDLAARISMQAYAGETDAATIWRSAQDAHPVHNIITDTIALPPVVTLRERLARPRRPRTYRIDGLQPSGSRVILAAQY
jgi:hypothetical protein